ARDPSLLQSPSHRYPYTTLFRSLPDGREGGVPQVLVLVARHETDALRLERIQGVADFLQRSLGIEKRQRREAREAALDTLKAERSEEQRLNSSHRTISYAVFCLK